MRFMTFATLAGLTVACTPKDNAMGGMDGSAMKVDSAAVMAGMDSLRTSYARLQVQDRAQLGQLYTDDATLDVYGLPRAKGRTAIEAGFQADPRKFTVSEITPIATFPISNEGASQIGTYHNMYDLNGTMTHEWGRFVVGVDKGTDGKWRVSYLMAFPDSTTAEKK